MLKIFHIWILITLSVLLSCEKHDSTPIEEHQVDFNKIKTIANLNSQPYYYSVSPKDDQVIYINSSSPGNNDEIFLYHNNSNELLHIEPYDICFLQVNWNSNKLYYLCEEGLGSILKVFDLETLTSKILTNNLHWIVLYSQDKILYTKIDNQLPELYIYNLNNNQVSYVGSGYPKAFNSKANEVVYKDTSTYENDIGQTNNYYRVLNLNTHNSKLIISGDYELFRWNNQGILISINKQAIKNVWTDDIIYDNSPYGLMDLWVLASQTGNYIIIENLGVVDAWSDWSPAIDYHVFDWQNNNTYYFAINEPKKYNVKFNSNDSCLYFLKNTEKTLYKFTFR